MQLSSLTSEAPGWVFTGGRTLDLSWSDPSLLAPSLMLTVGDPSGASFPAPNLTRQSLISLANPRWLNVALFGALIVAMFVFLPETKWNRDDQMIPVAPAGVDPLTKDPSSEEKFEDVIVEKHIDDKLGKGRPNKKQMSPIPSFSGSKKSFLRDIVTPWTLFIFPIVHFASFVTSWSSSCFLILNLTQSFVFAAPPYNFSAASVGYTNLAGASLSLPSPVRANFLLLPQSSAALSSAWSRPVLQEISSVAFRPSGTAWFVSPRCACPLSGRSSGSSRSVVPSSRWATSASGTGRSSSFLGESLASLAFEERS